MATDETYIPGQLYTVNLNELLPDPEQPRKYMDPAALAEMVESIKEHGIIQPPTFRLDGGGLRYIVTGERRCAAARMAGLTEIAAVYTDRTDYDELSLIENILRADLTAVEEAEAMDRLMKKHNFSQDELAKKLSKSKATISSTLSLNKLPPEILDECRKDPAMPKRVLVEIAQKRQTRSMVTSYQKYRAQMNPQNKTRTGARLSVTQTACNVLTAAGQKIDALDIQSLTREERGSLATAMAVLQKIIESKFQAMAH